MIYLVILNLHCFTISNSSSSESNFNTFQVEDNYECQVTNESQINTSGGNIINDNFVNDTITENNEPLLSREIHNASNYGNIVNNLDDELKEIRMMKHNRYLRDCETHQCVGHRYLI